MTQPTQEEGWERDDGPGRRSPVVVVVLIGLVILVGVLARGPISPEDPDELTVDEASPPPTSPPPNDTPSPALSEVTPLVNAVVGEWTMMAEAPFVPTDASAGVWAGQRLLVFDHSDTGAMWSYDPSSDTWAEGPEAPLRRLGGHLMTWTGGEVVIWGGRGPDGLPAADGMVYSPVAGWRLMSQSPLSARTDPGGGWSAFADAVIVWGGESAESANRLLADGALYVPRDDEWVPLPDLGLTPRAAAHVLDVGDGVALVGGRAGPDVLTDGAFLLPEQHVRAIPATPVTYDSDVALTGDGTALLAWGRPASGLQDLPGYRWDPSAGGWAALPRLLNQERGDADAVAMGGAEPLVVWGGLERRGTERQTDGFVLVVSSGSWRLLPPAPLSARVDAVVVAAGDELLVWGGSSGGIAPRDGAFMRLPRVRS